MTSIAPWQVRAPAAYTAARTSVARYHAASREYLRIVGPDSLSFTQGMVSNDVAALAHGDSAYACVLTNKGALLADGWVHRIADAVVLELPAGRADAVEQHLLRHLVSEEAEISRVKELTAWEFLGPEAPKVVAQFSPIATRPSELGGTVALCERGTIPPAAPDIDDETREVLRVEAGIPQFGVDMGETTIPLEAGLTRAINYQKGCYVGQEIIARATYRGQVKRILRGVVFHADGSVESAVTRDGKNLGSITSLATSPHFGRTLGLGILSREFAPAGSPLPGARAETADVIELPFALPARP